MNFDDERFVKIYPRNTTNWKLARYLGSPRNPGLIACEPQCLHDRGRGCCSFCAARSHFTQKFDTPRYSAADPSKISD